MVAHYDKDFGRTVVVKHDDGSFYTRYAHLDSFESGIHKNVRVKQGQVLGYLGSSGEALGPHVHFQFYDSGYDAAHSQSTDSQLQKLRIETSAGTASLPVSINQFLAGTTYFSTNVSGAGPSKCLGTK
jgi:murein DD-endopeptidase MepM/ murein hydrolase activator NlpD